MAALPTTRFAVQDIHRADGVRMESWKFLDVGGRQIGMLGDQVATYDPRRRNWYRDAHAQPDRVIRNPPYVFATTAQVGMTLALKCRAALRRLNERRSRDGLIPWHTRFGVHVGEAVLGNVGSSDRIDYTAIGDTVNIASRLEALNKYYGTGILVSGNIADVCSAEFLFRRVDRSQPKGAGRPLDVFELLGMLEGPAELRATPEMIRLVQDWDRVHELYTSKDWLGTLDALQEFAAVHPDDVVAGIYLCRIVGFFLEPPPGDWDGAMRFSQK